MIQPYKLTEELKIPLRKMWELSERDILYLGDIEYWNKHIEFMKEYYTQQSLFWNSQEEIYLDYGVDEE